MSTVAGVRVDVPKEAIESFCRKHHVKKLALFGSVLRDDFGPESDVDVLVEFEPGQTPGLEFFDMQEELSALFGRKVELVSAAGLRNPFRRHEILSTQRVIFGV